MIVICKHVFLSIVWFSITIWGGSNKLLREMRGVIRIYLWLGKEKLTRSRVSWRECCMKKKYGGLRLVDLEATKTSFLCKCIIKAMEPSESNV